MDKGLSILTKRHHKSQSKFICQQQCIANGFLCVKDFGDVVKCKSIEEFNQFAQEYLGDRNLKEEERRKAYWALFYRWKEATTRESQ